MAEQIFFDQHQDTDDPAQSGGAGGFWEIMARGADDLMNMASSVRERTASEYFKEDGSGELKPTYHDGTKGPGAIGWNRHAVQFVARNDVERLMAAIGTWESAGGRKGQVDFGAVGPDCKGDHAYGAWQVMGKNIDSWGQEAGLGHVTLAQFMEKDANGQITARAQQLQHDIVFHQFEKHLKKGYTPEQAACIWFTGSPDIGRNPNDGHWNASTYVENVIKTYHSIQIDPNAAPVGADTFVAAASRPTPWKGRFDLAIGDSLAAAAVNAGVYGTTGSSPAETGAMAAVSRNPRQVLDFINLALDKNPEAVKGKNIILSSGASNDNSDDQMALITQQVEKLKAAGATVTLLGVGDRHDFQSKQINALLHKISKETDIAFAGEVPGLGADRVHPGNRHAEQDMVHNAELAANAKYGQGEGGTALASLGNAVSRRLYSLKTMILGDDSAPATQTVATAAKPKDPDRRSLAMVGSEAAPAAQTPAPAGKTSTAPTAPT